MSVARGPIATSEAMLAVVKTDLGENMPHCHRLPQVTQLIQMKQNRRRIGSGSGGFFLHRFDPADQAATGQQDLYLVIGGDGGRILEYLAPG